MNEWYGGAVYLYDAVFVFVFIVFSFSNAIRCAATTWKYLLLPLNCISCIWPYTQWKRKGSPSFSHFLADRNHSRVRNTICSLLVQCACHRTIFYTKCNMLFTRIGFRFDFQINYIHIRTIFKLQYIHWPLWMHEILFSVYLYERRSDRMLYLNKLNMYIYRIWPSGQ